MSAPALCSTCLRSIWECDFQDGTDCLEHAAASECSALSHLQAKSARPSELLYAGLQLDDSGTPILVLLLCAKCASTLAVSPESWLASAIHPPRLHVVEVTP